jgi:hypothetical protein
MKIARFVAVAAGFAMAATAQAQLTTAHSYTGNYGIEVRAFASAGANSAAGTLTLTDIPAGSTIVDAFVYTNGWFQSDNPGASVNGNGLGNQSPYAVQGDVYAYKWSATSFVTGNGNYTLNLGSANQIYFGAIAVVFSHPSLTAGTTVINDGVGILNGPQGTSFNSTTFNGLSAGPSRVQLVTQADNALGESGESILWNGNAIGGPIDANLGNYASLFDFAVNSQAGSNTLAISAPTNDHFGWHLAVVSNGLVPTPGTAAVMGLAALAAGRRRRA